MKPRRSAASEVRPGCGVFSRKPHFPLLRGADGNRSGTSSLRPRRCVSERRRAGFRPSPAQNLTSKLDHLGKNAVQGRFSRIPASFPACFPVRTMYSNTEEGSDPLSGISGPAMSDHGIGGTPGRMNDPPNVCMGCRRQGGRETFSGGNGFRRRQFPGGMHGFGAFFRLCLFLFFSEAPGCILIACVEFRCCRVNVTSMIVTSREKNVKNRRSSRTGHCKQPKR